MTPQEIFEYKAKWRQDAWSMKVFDDVFTKDWCRRNIPRQDWAFDRYADVDDSHLVLFHFQSDYNNFKEIYESKYP